MEDYSDSLPAPHYKNPMWLCLKQYAVNHAVNLSLDLLAKAMGPMFVDVIREFVATHGSRAFYPLMKALDIPDTEKACDLRRYRCAHELLRAVRHSHALSIVRSIRARRDKDSQCDLGYELIMACNFFHMDFAPTNDSRSKSVHRVIEEARQLACDTARNLPCRKELHRRKQTRILKLVQIVGEQMATLSLAPRRRERLLRPCFRSMFAANYTRLNGSLDPYIIGVIFVHIIRWLKVDSATLVCIPGANPFVYIEDPDTEQGHFYVDMYSDFAVRTTEDVIRLMPGSPQEQQAKKLLGIYRKDNLSFLARGFISRLDSIVESPDNVLTTACINLLKAMVELYILSEETEDLAQSFSRNAKAVFPFSMCAYRDIAEECQTVGLKIPIEKAFSEASYDCFMHEYQVLYDIEPLTSSTLKTMIGQVVSGTHELGVITGLLRSTGPLSYVILGQGPCEIIIPYGSDSYQLIEAGEPDEVFNRLRIPVFMYGRIFRSYENGRFVPFYMKFVPRRCFGDLLDDQHAQPLPTAD